MAWNVNLGWIIIGNISIIIVNLLFFSYIQKFKSCLNDPSDLNRSQMANKVLQKTRMILKAFGGFIVILLSIYLIPLILFVLIIILSFIAKLIVFLIYGIIVALVNAVIIILLSLIINYILSFFDLETDLEDTNPYLAIFVILSTSIVTMIILKYDLSSYIEPISELQVSFNTTLLQLNTSFNQLILHNYYELPVYLIILTTTIIIFLVYFIYNLVKIQLMTKKIAMVRSTQYNTFEDFMNGLGLGYMNGEDYYLGLKGDFTNAQEYFENKELGFKSIAEKDEAKSRGYKTKEELIEDENLGFSSTKERVKIEKLGFKKQSEYQIAKKAGVNSRKIYDELLKLGFKNITEKRDANSKGYSTKEDWEDSEKLGFESAGERDEIIALGFETKYEYVDARNLGFKNKQEMKEIKKLGFLSKFDKMNAEESGFHNSKEYYEALCLGIPNHPTYSKIIDDFRILGFVTYDDYVYYYPGLEENGFNSFQECKKAYDLGFRTLSEMNESLEKGFKNKEEKNEGNKLGFETKDEWMVARSAGFENKHEMMDAKDRGFSKGFDYELAVKYDISTYELYLGVIEYIQKYNYDCYESYNKWHLDLIKGKFDDFNIFMLAHKKEIPSKKEWENYLQFKKLNEVQKKLIQNAKAGALQSKITIGIITKIKISYPIGECPYCQGKDKYEIFRHVLQNNPRCPKCRNNLEANNLIKIEKEQNNIDTYKGWEKKGIISCQSLKGRIAVHSNCGAVDMEKVFKDYIHTKGICPKCEKKINNKDLDIYRARKFRS